ncbi:hypothetical protein SLOPH_1659 [Spraguea lophii 42_110]|uniref:RNA polymerase III subunit RPC82-related helix-turn-helix domain-containing protein n=1 Tax=Spraguea lophii (strain 42_110) TaxID=1358809 RepID=S7XHU3_SPRLO|nr:hypothetical protein SLOPH_1659 [Spraguea lophii 42_110]
MLDLIISDFDYLPYIVCKYLLKYNINTAQNISNGLKISIEDTFLGLSILIHQRIVKYSVIDNITYYKIYENEIKERLYFTYYIDVISKRFPNELNLFKEILFSGIYLMEENEITVLECNNVIKKADKEHIITFKLNTKIKKPTKAETKKIKIKKEAEAKESKNINDNKTKYHIVDYNTLKFILFQEISYDYISNRYNINILNYYKAVEKRSLLDRDLIKYILNEKIINFIDTIESSETKRLKSGKIEIRYKKLLENIRNQFIADLLSKNKKYEENISLKEFKRAYNAIFDNKIIEDKDITFTSLIEKEKIKWIILEFAKLGIINLVSLSNKKQDIRFYFAKESSLNIKRRLEDIIIEKIKLRKQYFKEECASNYCLAISDFLNVVKIHFIMNLELNE